MSDLMQPELFGEKLAHRVKENNAVLKAFGAKPLNFKTVLADYTRRRRETAALRGQHRRVSSTKR